MPGVDSGSKYPQPHGATGPSRKTDIVTLYNGDRVTGELKSMYVGLLEINTNSMGTIQIEWQEIAKRCLTPV